MFCRFCLTSCASTSNVRTRNYPKPSTNNSSQHQKLRYGSSKHTRASARIPCLSSYRPLFHCLHVQQNTNSQASSLLRTSLLLGVHLVYLPNYSEVALKNDYPRNVRKYEDRYWFICSCCLIKKKTFRSCSLSFHAAVAAPTFASSAQDHT